MNFSAYVAGIYILHVRGYVFIALRFFLTVIMVESLLLLLDIYSSIIIILFISIIPN